MGPSMDVHHQRVLSRLVKSRRQQKAAFYLGVTPINGEPFEERCWVLVKVTQILSRQPAHAPAGHVYKVELSRRCGGGGQHHRILGPGIQSQGAELGASASYAARPSSGTS